jgi:hypothetical protein
VTASMIAPTYRSVCQFTGQKAGPAALPHLPLPRGPRLASAPAPCGLPRHAPGRRVQFTQWDKARGAMETITGKVITHVDRTVTVQTDDGREIWTSCGHVVAAR